jgi:predicted ribosome quality control (RQC) complex YloA/Tae2 family protein
MILRKHLNNSRLVGVEQFGFDRVIRLEFEHGRGRLSLVIELFRDGNVVLLDEDGVIVRPLTHAKYASRSLKKGESYSPPPEAVDPRNLDRGSLDGILDGSDHALIRTLASRANLGRVYGSAVCSISGIDEGAQSDSLTTEQRDSLESALKEMLGDLDDGRGAISGCPMRNPRHLGWKPTTSQSETRPRLGSSSSPRSTCHRWTRKRE